MLLIAAAVLPGVVASAFALVATHMWLRSRFVLGPSSTEVRQAMQSLVDVSRGGDRLKWTRLVLLYAGLGALVVGAASREWLVLVMASAPFALLWWIRIRTTTAPAALILGTSTHSSVRRQRDVKSRLSPLRVVSLLDVDVLGDPESAGVMALDCFRTTNEDDWWLVITRLMDATPVIAIDAAAETTGVLREAEHILATDIAPKCVFLTPPDGAAPVLDRLLLATAPQRRALRVARYEDAPGIVASMLAEHVRRRGA